MKAKGTDPVIDELREVRHQISERFDHNPGKLVAHYMQLQEKYRNRLVVSGTKKRGKKRKPKKD
jgi:hypothetical protein